MIHITQHYSTMIKITQGLQLPLSWAQACGDPGQCGVSQAGVEDPAESAQNLNTSGEFDIPALDKCQAV